MKNKLLSYLVLAIGIFFLINLSRSIFGLLKKGEIITQTQKKLAQTRQENEKLQKELEEVQSQAYIEKQAREKLNLGKDGEIVIILPSISPLPEEKIKGEFLPNWKRWLEIFM